MNKHRQLTKRQNQFAHDPKRLRQEREETKEKKEKKERKKKEKKAQKEREKDRVYVVRA